MESTGRTKSKPSDKELAEAVDYYGIATGTAAPAQELQEMPFNPSKTIPAFCLASHRRRFMADLLLLGQPQVTRLQARPP